MLGLTLGLVGVAGATQLSPRAALADHPTVLLPVAGQTSAVRPRCDPSWVIPFARQNQPIRSNSSNQADIELVPVMIPDLGHAVELKVRGTQPTVSSVVLLIEDHSIEGFTAVVAHGYIKSKSRILLVSTVHSVFKFVGVDQYGNQFNTLNGGKVKWTFDERLVKRIPARESNFSRKYPYRDYEDTLIVQLVNEGTTTVTATMECTGISHSIQVVVVRPIGFDRPVLTILPGETVKLHLFNGVHHMTDGRKAIEIDRTLPIAQDGASRLVWLPGDTSIISFSPGDMTVTGLRTGTTHIKVTNGIYGEYSSAIATVHVTEPGCHACRHQ
jgi:hypothetical protein